MGSLSRTRKEALRTVKKLQRAELKPSKKKINEISKIPGERRS